MSYLASDLINAAFKKIGVIAAGELPNSDESADALQTLNALMESWSAEQVTVYQILNFTGALVAATATYTIGAGATFNTSRPLKIEAAGIITHDGLRHEMKIIGVTDWGKIEEKTLTGKLPKVLYNDNAFPLATLNVWPVPNATGSAPTLDLYLWRAAPAVRGDYRHVRDASPLFPRINLRPGDRPRAGIWLASTSRGGRHCGCRGGGKGRSDRAEQESNRLGVEPGALPQPGPAPKGQGQ